MKRLILCWLPIACGSNADDGSATIAEESAGEQGSSSSGTPTSESDSQGTTDGDAQSTSSGGSQSASEAGSGSETGFVGSCGDAATMKQCIVAGDDGSDESCAWSPGSTWTVDDAGACLPIDDPDAGACVITDQADDCGGTGWQPTCPDDFTVVYWRTTDVENDAIQLVAVDNESVCSWSAFDFEVCEYTAGDPPVYDPPQCACACPG